MKLSELHPQLTMAQREALAISAGISPAYLWQLATQWQGKRPSIEVVHRLVTAEGRLDASDLVEEFGQPKVAAAPKALEVPGSPPPVHVMPNAGIALSGEGARAHQVAPANLRLLRS